MLWPAVGDRLRVRPPLREVVVRPPVDPADCTEREDRDGGRLFGVIIMLLGMLTGRTESAGEDDAAFLRLSSSFFSSGTTPLEDRWFASFSCFTLLLLLPLSSFLGVPGISVAIVDYSGVCVSCGGSVESNKTKQGEETRKMRKTTNGTKKMPLADRKHHASSKTKVSAPIRVQIDIDE